MADLYQDTAFKSGWVLSSSCMQRYLPDTGYTDISHSLEFTKNALNKVTDRYNL